MEIIMETNQIDLKKYENAQKRVKELKGFITIIEGKYT